MAFAATVAIPLLLVRTMPQHEFGLYKQIFLVVNSAITMLPLGFGMTAFYFLPREQSARNQTVFNIVAFMSVVAALFAIVVSLFPSLLVLLFKEPAAAGFAPAIAAMVVLWLVGSFLDIVTLANQEVKIATAVIVATQVTRAAFFLIAAMVGGTVWALVVAAIVHGILQVTALMIYLNSRFPGFWRAYDGAYLRRQLAYALPFGAAGLLFSLQTDLHNYFVSNRFGPSTYAVYAIGCFQLPLFGILADSVGSMMIPRISSLQYAQQTREIVLVTARAMRKLAAVYFPAYVFLLVMRREVIVALFTSRYIESVPVFAINLTLIPLGVLITDPIMRAYAEHRHFLVKLHSALLIGVLVGLSLAISRFGLIGAIAVVIIVNCVGRVATLVKVLRILGVRAHDVALLADVGKLGAAAAIAGITTIVVRSLASGLNPFAMLVVCGLVFAPVFALAVLAFDIITPEERALVRDHVWRAIHRLRPSLAQTASLARE